MELEKQEIAQKRAVEAQRQAFADLPDGYWATAETQPFEFRSAKSQKPFGDSLLPLRIKLHEVEIANRELALTFEVTNRSNTDDSLLFVRDNKDPYYGVRLYIEDENGKKYFAMNGYEGGRIKDWNGSTGAYVIPALSISRPRIRFPIPDSGAKVVKFVSPSIHGQQQEWFWREIAGSHSIAVRSAAGHRSSKSHSTTNAGGCGTAVRRLQRPRYRVVD